MKNKLSLLIEKQISKLEDEDFDLEAWKSSTKAVISRIFGSEDARNDQIDQLKIDYSSWALRDSNSKYKPIESCKRKGAAILESAIEELEVFGLGNEKENVLNEFFSKKDVEKLLADTTDSNKIIKKMKKEELQELCIRLISITS